MKEQSRLVSMEVSYTPVFIGNNGIYALEVIPNEWVETDKDDPSEQIEEILEQLQQLKHNALDLFPSAASVDVNLTGNDIIYTDEYLQFHRE